MYLSFFMPSRVLTAGEERQSTKKTEKIQFNHLSCFQIDDAGLLQVKVNQDTSKDSTTTASTGHLRWSVA